MINQVKELLQARRWQKVAIIDDAFDLVPSIDDISPEKWDTFFDDLSEDDRRLLKNSFPDYDEFAESIDLARAPGFVEIVWSHRQDLSPDLAAFIFEEYKQDQKNKQGELIELEAVLEKLGLTVVKKGRTDAQKASETDIVFLDLFIGAVNTPEAYQRSVALIKDVFQRHKGNPPVVILMSTSPRLEKLGPQLRDDAELLGSMFRKIKKADLVDEGAVLEKLYDLALVFDDALKLLSFHKLWLSTLNRSAEQFLKMIRKLDLPDYANIHALVVDAEGVEIGDYMIDLFDSFLHYVVEGNSDLIAAAKGLNDVQWGKYPPPHFSPSPEAVDILEGTIFHNRIRTDFSTTGDGAGGGYQLHLGDVVWETNICEGKNDGGGAGSSEHNVFVLLSQSCDLLRNETDTLLFMRGTANPYSLKFHKRPSKDITPIITIDNEKYVLSWNPKLIQTWRLQDVGHHLTSGKFKIVSRFRHAYALQLQQSFLNTLGRVGVPSPLPGYYPVGVNIFYKNEKGEAQLLKEVARTENLVTCLAGRDETQVVTKLIIDPSLVDLLRVEMKRLDPECFYSDSRGKFVSAREDIRFFLGLKYPLRFSKSQRERPFSAQPDFDVIQFFPKPSLKAGAKLDGRDGPIIIEVVE